MVPKEFYQSFVILLDCEARDAPQDFQTFRRPCFLPEKAAAHSQIDTPLISAMYEAAIELIATNKLCVLYDGCLKLIIFYLHYCIYHAFFEKYKKVMPLQL